MTTKDETLSFEEAHQQLEKILAEMNSGKASLEESIALFEKGEKLMRLCEQHLQRAQQRIDRIVKDRNGNAAQNPDQTPKTAPFSPEGENVPF